MRPLSSGRTLARCGFRTLRAKLDSGARAGARGDIDCDEPLHLHQMKPRQLVVRAQDLRTTICQAGLSRFGAERWQLMSLKVGKMGAAAAVGFSFSAGCGD